MVQATPATSGGANSGSMLAAAIKPLNGVLVRTTIQENASPITTAIRVPPPQAIKRIEQRLGDVRVGQHGEEIGDRQMAEAEAVDHRIGVGERAQQQRQHGIDHQKAEDRQQQRDPQTGHHAPARAFTAAARDLGACRPACPCKSVFPLAGGSFLLLWPQCARNLVDRATAGKLAESRSAGIA